MRQQFVVSGIDNRDQVAEVEDRVSKVKGVENCRINRMTDGFTVDFDANHVTVRKIMNCVKQAGFTIKTVGDADPTKEYELTREKGSLIVAAVFSLPVLYLALVRLLPFISLPVPAQLDASRNPFFYAMFQMFCSIPIIIAGRGFYMNGFWSVINRTPNTDTLVMIGTGCAFIYSEYAVFQILAGRTEMTGSLYFEAVAVVITLILLGNHLIKRNKLKASDTARKLIRLTPEIATVMNEGKLLTKSTNVEKSTMMAQIARMVDESQGKKTPISKIADKVSGAMVVAVIIIAAVSALLWWIAGKNMDFALNIFVSVLIIGCPCSVGLATSIAIIRATGCGAHKGILFKSGEILEVLSRTDTAVLAKTGVLTSRENTENGVSDTLKPTSHHAIKCLREIGMKVMMLTGDNKQAADVIAGQAEISKVISDVPPERMADEILALKDKGRKVVMIGDGTNDAPALAEADVGMSFAEGDNIAIENADVVLLGDNLHLIYDAIVLSRAAMRNIRQNLFWAFIYNICGIPLAAGIFYWVGGLLLNPMLSAFIMTLSSVSVILNSRRLKRHASDNYSVRVC